MLAWSWAGDGGRPRGHSAVLVKDDDGVCLWDPHTGRHRYDPETGRFEDYEAQDLVAKIVVGYLDADGVAVDELLDRDAQLADADEIGYVQGLPGDIEDDRTVYRAQGPGTRVARPEFADPLIEVLGGPDGDRPPDEEKAHRVAKDVSGKYGRFSVEFGVASISRQNCR